MFATGNAAKIDKARKDALSCANSERASFENMIARCRAAGEVPAHQLISDFEEAMATCEARILGESSIDEFEWLEYQAAKCGQLRAYLCPLSEIYNEGAGLVDLLQDWGFSDVSVRRLRSILETNCKNPQENPELARGTLRSIMNEVDISEDYLEDFEDDVLRLSWILLIALSVCLVCGFLGISFSTKSTAAFSGIATCGRCRWQLC